MPILGKWIKWPSAQNEAMHLDAVSRCNNERRDALDWPEISQKRKRKKKVRSE